MVSDGSDGSDVRQWDQRINHKTTPIKSLKYRRIEISLGLIDLKLISLVISTKKNICSL